MVSDKMVSNVYDSSSKEESVYCFARTVSVGLCRSVGQMVSNNSINNGMTEIQSVVIIPH